MVTPRTIGPFPPDLLKRVVRQVLDERGELRVNAAFWTIEQIMTHLHVSRSKVEELIRSGDLRVHRIGRQIRVSDSEFSRFLNRCANDRPGVREGQRGAASATGAAVSGRGE